MSLWATALGAEDLSHYRGLALGSSLATAAKAARMEPSAATVIHQRPVLIQELEWQPRQSYATNHSTEPVKEVVLTFYDGELYRIAVKYDRFQHGGDDAEDLIAAISQVYGTASKPVGGTTYDRIACLSRTGGQSSRDGRSSVFLQSRALDAHVEFSMILLSKRLDELAKKAARRSPKDG